MRSGFKKRESGCLVSAPEMRRLHMQFNRKAAFPILAGIRNTKPAAAKKGSRSGTACAAPAFSCPSCAALQCRRPACTGSRAAPAGFSSSTPGFTPKTAPRFLAWRVFTRYAGGVRAARWCAGRSVSPKRGAQNAKRAICCGRVPKFFMERKAPFAEQRSLSDVAANIWKSAIPPQYAQNQYFDLYAVCSGTFLRGFRGLHCAKAPWRKAVSRRTCCRIRLCSGMCRKTILLYQVFSVNTRKNRKIRENPRRAHAKAVLRRKEPRLCRSFRCRRGPVCFVRFTPKRFVFQRGFVPCAIRNLRAVSPILSAF